MRGPSALAVLLLGVFAAPARSEAQTHVPLQRGGVVYGWSDPRCPASGSETAERIAECLSTVMFPRGLHGGATKAEVPVETAALLCRGARSQNASRALSQCVRGLLYERSGLGSRREAVDAQSAVTACRWAYDVPRASAVEECMRRLLYDREGLGHQRTQMSAETAAQSCQSTAAPAPLPVTWLPFGFVPVPGLHASQGGVSCQRPPGDEGVRFLSECVRRLVQRKVPADSAALACEGAISPWP